MEWSWMIGGQHWTELMGGRQLGVHLHGLSLSLQLLQDAEGKFALWVRARSHKPWPSEEAPNALTRKAVSEALPGAGKPE